MVLGCTLIWMQSLYVHISSCITVEDTLMKGKYLLQVIEIGSKRELQKKKKPSVHYQEKGTKYVLLPFPTLSSLLFLLPTYIWVSSDNNIGFISFHTSSTICPTFSLFLFLQGSLNRPALWSSKKSLKDSIFQYLSLNL